MKNSPMATALLVALAISAFVSLFLCWRFTANVVEDRSMRGYVATKTDLRNRTLALIQASMEYAKHKPGIMAYLDSLGIKPNTNAPAGQTPSK
jgi:hypothetical protein